MDGPWVQSIGFEFDDLIGAAVAGIEELQTTVDAEDRVTDRCWLDGHHRGPTALGGIVGQDQFNIAEQQRMDLSAPPKALSAVRMQTNAKPPSGI
jgi:hypothetical protein